MASSSFRATSLVQYLKKRRGIQNIHSPFLFNLMQAVFNDSVKNRASFFEDIERVRRENMNNLTQFDFEDFGAGGDQSRNKRITVSQIASSSLKHAKYTRFLYRLSIYLKPRNIVELGTSLGITTTYLSKSMVNEAIVTVEADQEVNRFARQNWEKLGVGNIKDYVFDLNEKWTFLAHELSPIDFLFIDANHRKEAVIRYVVEALPFLHNTSVIIVDDIHWSKEMQEAWETLTGLPQVTLSVDIYQMGLLFFNKDLSKENFILKY